MKKVSSIKERIKEFAENTGENKDLFFEKIGVTSANFRGKKLQTGVNADLIEKIVSIYPDIDLHWVITGNESKKVEKQESRVIEAPESYGKNYKNLYIEVLEENRQLNKELISELKTIKDRLEKNQIEALELSIEMKQYIDNSLRASKNKLG